MLLRIIECESECNVFVVVHSLFVCFALLAFLSSNIKFKLLVSVLGGNSDDPVSIPTRIGTVVVSCII